MLKYYEKNKDRLTQKMVEINVEDLGSYISKAIGLSVTSEIFYDDTTKDFSADFSVDNTPFVISIGPYMLDQSEFLSGDNTPKKDYTSDEEFLKDFKELDEEFVNGPYCGAIEELTLTLTKYTKCGLDKIHAIFDAFEYTYIDDVEDENYGYDEDEFLGLCLRKLVYEND